MTVDSFKFLPRLISVLYKADDREPDLPIPWTPLAKPVSESVFGLVTTGGLYHKGVEEPFDLEREKAEPTWGDPTFRAIPSDLPKAELGVSHLHLNPKDILEDINILLPINRFQELAVEGVVGGLAKYNYSFMGFQGQHRETNPWRETYGPQIAEKFKDEGVDCVLLTPA